MIQNLINTENGTFYFGNKEFISAKTTYQEIRKMKGTIDSSFENSDLGIQSLSFFEKEIEGNFYDISVHFNFGKLSMIFVQFQEGKLLPEMPFWNEMKRLKKYSNPKKSQMKRKNYHWGSVFASYDTAENFGQFNMSYK